MPETGTTQFFYDSKRRLDYKLDAKGQKTQMIYDNTTNRVLEVRRFATSTSAEDTCHRVTNTYDTDATGLGKICKDASRRRRTNFVWSMSKAM